MVALDHNRTRSQLVVVERAAGDGGKNGVVVNALAVEGRRDVIADHDRLERLPFTRGPTRADVRGFPTVNGQQILAAGRCRVAGAE